MKKNSSVLLLLLIQLTYFMSCNGDSSIKESVALSRDFEMIKIDTNAKPQKISEYATRIDYVPLETSQDILIGKIDKIEFSKNLLYILDKRSAKSVFVFNNSGKFLFQKKVKNNEMRNAEVITDFYVDEKHNILYILAGEEKSIYLFETPSGKFQRKINIKGFFKKLVVVNPDTLLLIRDGHIKYQDYYGEYRICQIDSKGKLIRKWIDNALLPNLNSGDITCTNQDGKFLISRMYNDTIYSYQDDNINAVYKIDLGVPSAPAEFYLNNDYNKFQEQMKASNIFYIHNVGFFNTKKKLSFYLKSGETFCHYYYDKSSKTGNLAKYLINDIDNVTIPFLNFANDSLFISAIDASVLQQQYNLVSSSPDFKTHYSNLILLNQKIAHDSNPVIAFIKLK